MLRHLSIFLISITVLTGNYYFLQHLQFTYPDSIIYLFWIGILILTISGYLTFHTITTYSYKKYERLSFLAETASFLMWGLYFGFPTLYSPYNWAWSFVNVQILPQSLVIVGKILIIGGLIGIVYSMIWLGLNGTLGEKPSFVKSKGPYKYSRNPQLLSCLILISGFIVIRPTLFNIIWLLLYLFLSKAMIRSEENHLTDIFGDKYQAYYKKTNRWIVLRR